MPTKVDEYVNDHEGDRASGGRVAVDGSRLQAQCPSDQRDWPRVDPHAVVRLISGWVYLRKPRVSGPFGVSERAMVPMGYHLQARDQAPDRLTQLPGPHTRMAGRPVARQPCSRKGERQPITDVG